MTYKKKRQSAARTRALMVEVGAAQLAARGLNACLADMTIDRTLSELDGVARSSAYNAWSVKAGDRTPQQRFQREVILHFIQHSEPQSASLPAAPVERIVANNPTLTTRTGVRKEVARVMCDAFIRGLAADRIALTRFALFHALASVPVEERDTELLDLFAQADRASRNGFIRHHVKPVIAQLGLRPRPSMQNPHFWDQFVAAASAFGATICVRSLLFEEGVLDDVTIVGEDGIERPWTVFAVGFDAMMSAYFEIDPDAESALLAGLLPR